MAAGSDEPSVEVICRTAEEIAEPEQERGREALETDDAAAATEDQALVGDGFELFDSNEIAVAKRAERRNRHKRDVMSYALGVLPPRPSGASSRPETTATTKSCHIM
jgi:hypothetical protein